MRDKNENGFSLVELLLVVVIIGIIATISIPAFQKGIWASENGRAQSNLRTIHSTQVGFYSQRGRFARLSELNTELGGGLGTIVDDALIRGTYVFEMEPMVPTDDDLRTEYIISATRSVGSDAVYRYSLDQSGVITPIFP